MKQINNSLIIIKMINIHNKNMFNIDNMFNISSMFNINSMLNTSNIFNIFNIFHISNVLNKFITATFMQKLFLKGFGVVKLDTSCRWNDL
jgi:hypothetical protein